ncbi:MAG: hypothetical protein ACYS9T_01720 [Planctomycetota bacterium]|jgi:hypothetical protein
MKTITGKKMMKAGVVSLIVLVSCELVWSQHQDNAALLYYQAFMLYQEPQDGATLRALGEVLKGRAEPNETVSKYVEQNRPALKLALTAAEIPDCDWGLDFSQGTSMQIPHLRPIRSLSQIVIAEARILAAHNEYRTALGRCLSAHKMAAHAGDDMIISVLVGIRIADMANECIQAILSEMPQDLQTLYWLKEQLAKVERRPATLLKLKKSIMNDANSTSIDLTKDKINKVLSVFLEPIVALSGDNSDRKQTPRPQEQREEADFDLEKAVVERVRAADEQFFERNRAYWQEHAASAAAALDLPYAEAYRKLKELDDRPKKAAVHNTDATLTAILVPACDRIYNYEVKRNTLYNAIVTAVDIYITIAKTGQLPDALPPGSPKDLFSAQYFEYEKGTDGFILRCRAKDLDKEKIIHEYEFKVRN